MNVTQLTFVLFPLCLFFITKPERQLELIFVFGTMPAAAALVFGGFGVQPNLIPAMFFLGYVLLQMLLGVTYRGTHLATRYFIPFIGVTIYAVIGSIILPRLFAGQVFVWPQKVDGLGGAVLLQPSASNLTQDSYIIINTVFLVIAACFCTRPGVDPRRLLNAYFASGFLVSGVCFWQLANKVAHVPFPQDFFFSNPGWSLLTEQSFSRVPRINGSFPEPAAAATYLAGIVFSTTWTILKNHTSVMARILLPVALLAMLITTSTTGYAALAIGVVILVLYTLSSGSTQMFRRVALACAAAIGFAMLAIVTVVIFAPNTVEAASTVLTATMSKGNSSSYNDRTSTDLDSLALVLPTYGLGVGWGSNRASSLIPSLLSSVGIYGVLGLLWFNFSIFRKLKQARRMNPTPDQLMVLDATSMALIGRLTAICLSGPNVTFTDFYLLAALQAATIVNIQLSGRGEKVSGSFLEKRTKKLLIG